MRTRGIAFAVVLWLAACGKKGEEAKPADPPPAAAPADAAAASAPVSGKPSQPELAVGDLAKKRESYGEALHRGRTAIDADKADEAVEAFDAALAARPGDAVALSELSWAAFSAGDHARAIEAATASVAATQDPSLQAASLYNRGRAYEAHGDKDKAIADYQRSYELRPHKVVRGRLDKLGAKVPESVWTATVLAGPFPTVDDFCKTVEEGCDGKPNDERNLTDQNIPWAKHAQWISEQHWDDDREGFSATLLFETDDGWWALRWFDRYLNHYLWRVERTEVIDGVIAIHSENEWGRFETDNERRITVCGIGPSKRPSCLGPIVLADWFKGWEGGKEDGHDLPDAYGANCTAKLVAADRLEIKAADAGCRKKIGFAGEHKLAFP